MPTAPEPLGLKLKALRNHRDLSQAELGDELGLSGRVISNIEIGRRQLTQTEIETIENKYGVRLADIDTSVVRRVDPSVSRIRIYSESQFFDYQETFLNERDGGHYTLWFMNPESLPMLESEKVRSTWIQNISSGTSYHTVWIVDVIDKGSFRHFIERARKALGGAAAIAPANVAGSIHIHLVQLNSDPPDEVSDFILAYKKACDESRNGRDAETIRFHEPVQRLTRDAREFITRFNFYAASVVFYEPDPESLSDRELLALELKDVSDIAGSESSRAYVLLGRATTKEFLRGLKEFKASQKATDEATEPKIDTASVHQSS